METLHNRIKSSLKDAMKNKDTLRLNVIRGLLSSFTNEAVALGRTPQDLLTDEEVTIVVLRTVKQRKDAIAQFESALRTDLADEDKAQLEVLMEYAPQMMSISEVEEKVKEVIANFGPVDKSGAGKLMGAVMKELKGKADSGDVKKVIDKLVN